MDPPACPLNSSFHVFPPIRFLLRPTPSYSPQSLFSFLQLLAGYVPPTISNGSVRELTVFFGALFSFCCCWFGVFFPPFRNASLRQHLAPRPIWVSPFPFFHLSLFQAHRRPFTFQPERPFFPPLLKGRPDLFKEWL